MQTHPTRVQDLCTVSTWALYSEYMGFVLEVHEPCTEDKPSLRLCLLKISTAKHDYVARNEKNACDHRDCSVFAHKKLFY